MSCKGSLPNFSVSPNLFLLPSFSQYKLHQSLNANTFIISEQDLNLTSFDRTTSKSLRSEHSDDSNSQSRSARGEEASLKTGELVELTRVEAAVTNIHRLPKHYRRILRRFTYDQHHACIVRLHGIVELDMRTAHGGFYMVTEACRQGSVRNVLNMDSYNIDAVIQFSIIIDLLSGLEYLHHSSIVHGFINTGNCKMDGKFTAKVGLKRG